MYFLAIDAGTSSTRAALYRQGELCQISQYALQQYYPNPGWVEQDPNDIWEKTLQAVKDVVSRVNPAHIRACGITNQRETSILWDKNTGRCIGPAISWQDRRTEKDFHHMSQEIKNSIHQKTGLHPDAYFSASKIRWIIENFQDAGMLIQQKQLAFGTIDSFLLWRLTNGRHHYTDVTNASRTLLYDIKKHDWDDELLTLFHIPRAILPKVVANDFHFGDMDPGLVGEAIPITGMIGDQQASLLGQMCVNPGMIKATYGSGGFLVLNTGENSIWSTHGILTTIAYRIKNQTTYAMEGNIYHAGTSLKWLRDGLGVISDYQQIERMVAASEGQSGLYFVPSFSGLGAPYWLSTNGAMICGLNQNTHANDLVRAALAAVAFQTQDILLAMQADFGRSWSCLRIDGGLSRNTWLCQYLSSLSGITTERSEQLESTALGAAIVAAIGSGAVSSFHELETWWKLASRFEPDESSSVLVNAEYAGWQDILLSMTSSMKKSTE